ncbi:MAG: phytoene desaturase [Bacteroidales bacterium]|nr:phytoene desaturase [Bacteroidales bacterium]
MKVGIIGSGLGGLAIAIRLANKGYQVEVFEKNAHPGGKIFELRSDGFRFDGGASIFTLPGLLRELYEESGENMDEYFSYSRLQVSCKYFFEDGSTFSFYDDKTKLFREIEESSDEEPERLKRHLRKAGTAFDAGSEVFLFSSLYRLRNYFTRAYLRVLFQLNKLDVFRSMHTANRSHFKDDKLIRIFDRYATYTGSDPYRAPATLNMIAHLENNLGTYFPDQGMYTIITNLVKLAEKKGVQFRFNSPVETIRISKGKAKALVVNKEEIPYDLIISDADIRYLYNNMLCDRSGKRFQRQEPSSSALIFYWGIKKQHPDLQLHNVFFTENFKEEFDHVFKHRKLYTDPTIYVFISSKYVPGDAPVGCENWYVMINTPPDSGNDWDTWIDEARQIVFRKLNRILKTDLQTYLVNEKIVWPKNIEETTWSAGGSLYGNASNSVFASFLRHPNFSNNIKNLYFVGGSVHPGGGIPLCLGSAKIVDKLIPPA